MQLKARLWEPALSVTWLSGPPVGLTLSGLFKSTESQVDLRCVCKPCGRVTAKSLEPFIWGHECKQSEQDVVHYSDIWPLGMTVFYIVKVPEISTRSTLYRVERVLPYRNWPIWRTTVLSALLLKNERVDSQPHVCLYLAFVSFCLFL